jgi:hypothetical protein
MEDEDNLVIELDFYEINDLKTMIKTESFNQCIEVNTLECVLKAIDDKKDKVLVFILSQFNTEFYLDKSQYKDFLKKILFKLEKDEDYIKCTRIDKYIKQI